ncbi:MAG TPA: redoxin family protein [Bdellovibrio sp.]|nr:redoxin family protein [Bdellovibrio sp.]
MNVLSGETVKLDLTGKKGSVVVFLSAKCPCSGSHEVVLNDLAKEYPDFIFVGVHSNADEDKTITKNHFAEAKLSFPVLQDSRSAWANQLGALKTPHAFVFNPKGELLYQGGVTDSHVGPAAKKTFLKDVLSDIQSGKAPRMKEGRALGCFIQREG